MQWQKSNKKVARRCIEFISGNINSYTRILNGPQQLAQIKTYNDLATSILVLKAESLENEARLREEKKDEEKAAAKAKKMKENKEERERMAPGCRDNVEKGIDHVLRLNMTQRKQILKFHFHFGVQTGLYKMKLPETEQVLRRFMMPANIDVDDVSLPQLPAIGEAGEEGEEAGALC